ncbi:hypothetical protein RhiirA5_397146 [Rhizophagus irregularis]|uniref:Uncharacterized protein n=5 Tax=Rhizophagus irregularis TaxID=588596 RepID=A0A2N0PYU8_9GLOM|nr:hypothetical protein RirG_090570 [Rhizophagus irregularis DAOM 197198w]PKC12009.1 hypothetical protein RhiirA5_397146 [Rhizophagus irregularis]GBC12757.1 hypothetical protein GLOIN_2v1472513 [Rhizophagus irregularis DAOM 181602=DAOM 197198]UZO19725.1 hypothetical protein OCT59_010998 [Rhizophagus irregularis]CAB4400425.1 unnamed protein product [Rhizophagus irregularis]
MSSQSAIGSLAFSSGAVVTASSMGYVFGRPVISKKRRTSNTSMDTSSNSSNINAFTPSSSTSSFTTTNISPKSPLKRFKLFSSKSKRSKVSSSTYISQKTPSIVIRPDQVTDDDDDISSMYSEVTSLYIMNDRDRKTLSVPNLPAALHQSQQHCDNSPSISIMSSTFNPRCVTGIVEEEEEDENWDAQSDSGYDEPLSKAAGKSTSTLPLSNSPPPPKRHTRCKSLPPISVKDYKDYSPSLYHRQPTPSEVWDEDEDFDLGNTDELNVPSLVEESQVSLRMDISNIRDFVFYIGELKVLRDEKEKLCYTIQTKTTRRWTNGFLRPSSKKVKYLENIFKQDWGEADVIIDIADVAQDNETTFSGGKRVEVDIERIPSERHLKIFKKIVKDSLGDEAKNLELFNDDDKENQYDPSKKIKEKFKARHSKNIDENENEVRKEDFKISVEVMPSLIDYLKKLQVRLDIHIKELNKLTHTSSL